MNREADLFPLKRIQPWLQLGYGWLLGLYPRAYRRAFADEMHAVFAEALTAAIKQGWHATALLCWREVRDVPRLLVNEHWKATRQWFALSEDDLLRSDLPGVVPVGDGSLPHVLFIVAGRHPRLRRFLDVTIALAGLLLVAPFILLLPIFIKLDSSGPIFYRQQRLGKGGQRYTMYKFRSMYINRPEQKTATLATPEPIDPRITPIGRLTRRWHLDELPQILNVLKGDMSIFGPRPPMPS